MKENTQRERVRDFILKEFDVSPEHLWERYQGYEVFRDEQSRKWFAIIMDVKPESVRQTGDKFIDILNVKCDEGLVDSLLHEEGFVPAYHMNKRKWISVILDGTVRDDYIFKLVSESKKKTTKKTNNKQSQNL